MSGSQTTLLTLLTVFAIIAQSTVTLVAVPLGPTRPAVGTGAVHARVGRILHVHAKGKVLGQGDVAVIQHDLTTQGEEKPSRRKGTMRDNAIGDRCSSEAGAAVRQMQQ